MTLDLSDSIKAVPTVEMPARISCWASPQPDTLRATGPNLESEEHTTMASMRRMNSALTID